MLRICLLVASCLALPGISVSFSASAQEGIQKPFGIDPTRPVTAIEGARKDGPGRYRLTSVPRPIASLTAYAAEATEAGAVCEIKGYIRGAPRHRVDPAIRTLRKQLDELLGQPAHALSRDDDETDRWVWTARGDGPVLVVHLRRYEANGNSAAMLGFAVRGFERCDAERAARRPPNPFR